MLICFGVSWPFSIIKALRTRHVRGKSRVFLSFVFVGYVAGVISKLVYAHVHSTPVEWVTALYAFNGALVFIDLLLYLRFSKKDL